LAAGRRHCCGAALGLSGWVGEDLMGRIIHAAFFIWRSTFAENTL